MLRHFVQRFRWQRLPQVYVGDATGFQAPRQALGAACREARTSLVSHASPRRMTAAAAAGSGEAVGAGEAAAASGSGQHSYEDWRGAWTSFLDYLYAHGHYAADPGVSRDALDSNPGAMKRAVLSLVRQRGDILHSLDHAKLAALTKAGFPTDDRKTKNAHRRLQASILDGQHLPPADGGPAELQDVARMLLSLAACDPRETRLFRPLMAAALALLPDITAAAEQPPAPGAAAQGSQRYMPTKREPGEVAAQRPRGQRTPQGGRGEGPGQEARQRPQRRRADEGEGLEWGGQRWFDGPARGSSGGSSPQGRSGRGGGGRGGTGRGGRGGAGRGGAPGAGRGSRQQPRRQDGGGGGQQGLGWWYSGDRE